MVVFSIAVIDGTFVPRVLNVVRRDEDDEYEVNQDEHKETEVEEHQLRHLANSDKQDGDSDQGQCEEKYAENQRNTDGDEPKGQTPGMVVISNRYKTTIIINKPVKRETTAKVSTYYVAAGANLISPAAAGITINTKAAPQATTLYIPNRSHFHLVFSKLSNSPKNIWRRKKNENQFR